jgi:NAD(P)H-hydrate repair Nnr-like enzyme with NAD(P)H-hydrate dehydratase domain
VVATPRGLVWVNGAGNSGMATAGAGDVLTGLIAGFLAQGLAPVDAALCGMFVHGLAGDLAASAKSSRAMTAGDISDFTGAAFIRLETKA